LNLLPALKDIISTHCLVAIDLEGDVAIFFGFSAKEKILNLPLQKNT
jgi:ATP-dependent phosphoenolpyruvate carboxykinase